MINDKINNRYYKTTGMILKHSPIGEADRLLTVYTANMGKLKLVAKGVRRTKSKLGGHLDLLNHSQLEVSRGRNLDTISSALSINSFQLLRENLRKTADAFYCLDLVDSLTPENEPDHNIFLNLVETLEKMLHIENPLIIWHFSFKLLYLTGYLPELYNCGNCQIKIQPNKHAFNSILGGIVCENCSIKLENNLQTHNNSLPISINTIKILRYFKTHTLDNIISLNVEQSVVLEIQKALLSHITASVERNLKSTLFLNHISKFISKI
jgi:DNA repair protein RecO (recombination protein O)